MNQPQRPYEILIAEDNGGDLLLVEEALNRQKIICNLQTASDGATALELIERLDREPQPLLDLIIVDLNLPVYDGIAVLERLRRTVHLGATPVIVLSGLSTERIRNQTMNYEPVHPFTKPADLNGFMKLGSLAHSILRPELKSPVEGPTLKAREGAA
jgi:CheY-like chemotaxis protein